MNSLLVFGLVFGGAGAFVSLFLFTRTFINPKKLESIQQALDSGNVKSALRQSKSLLARNEKNVDAHWFLGECYRAEKRPDLAVAEYKYVTNSGRFTPTATERKVRERLAEEYLKLGELDESQKEYILLSRIEPNNYLYFYNIAQLFEKRNYTDSALVNYKKTIALNPTHAPSYRDMGVIFFRKQLYPDARKSLMSALKHDPQDYSVYFYLAMISKTSGDPEAALTQFEKAMQNPRFKQRALFERASIFMVKGDTLRTIGELERALKLGREDSQIGLAIHYLLAQCYESNKELPMAVGHWEFINSIDPKYRDVAEKLAMYSEVRADDRLKDFLTASQPKFQEVSARLVSSLGLAVQDVFVMNQDFIEITALETQSKWRNAKKSPSIVHIYRSAKPVGYEVIRGLYDKMRKVNASRSICIAASKFTRSAVEFAQIRPIDLVDKEELTRLLQTL